MDHFSGIFDNNLKPMIAIFGYFDLTAQNSHIQQFIGVNP